MRRHARSLLLGRPLHSRERYAPFFIVGSGRCGTTLLRAILDANPSIHIPPETYVLGGVIREYRLFSRLPWTVLLRILLARIEYHDKFFTFEMSLRDLYRELLRVPRSSQNLAFVLNRFYTYHAARYKPTATRWADKTPNYAFELDPLREVFPDIIFVHMLRDGRDVSNSYVKSGLIPNVEAAADLWVRSVRAVSAFARQHPNQVVEVRYEELVARPRDVLVSLCTSLDLEFIPEMLEHHSLKRVLGDAEKLPHLANAKGKITSARIGQWRSDLTLQELRRIETKLDPVLRTLGYDT